jgi:hypothetical protein
MRKDVGFKKGRSEFATIREIKFQKDRVGDRVKGIVRRFTRQAGHTGILSREML